MSSILAGGGGRRQCGAVPSGRWCVTWRTKNWKTRERERYGTGILFEEPNPTGSRPSDLIGLYRKWQRTKRPQPGELGIGIQQLKRHARSAVAVVMVASSEQANAWRPGREEAVKAMGLVRGMVYSSRRETPTGEKEQQGRGGGRQRLFERETEHLWLRQLMHGIGGGPR